MKALMLNYNFWSCETDPKILKSEFTKILQNSDFGIINFVEHHFEPYGWTGLWLLSESHLAIHTFPEENKSYIELSSCVERPFKRFIDEIKNKDFYVETW